MKKYIELLAKLNPSKQIADHVFGENHTNHHRKIAGGILMVFGVGMVYAAQLTGLHLLQFTADVVGFGIHGYGLHPYITPNHH